jgi:hypothetical protein
MVRLFLVMAAILAGCTAAPHVAQPLQKSAPIEVDQRVYTARSLSVDRTYQHYGFDVVARFTNTTADTVFLARDFANQPRPNYWVWMAGGDSTRSAFNAVSSGVGHDRQIAVAPGGVRVDTLRLQGPTIWVGPTQAALGALEGPMRLVYLPQSCRGDGRCRLPYEVATSAPFEVRLE